MVQYYCNITGIIYYYCNSHQSRGVLSSSNDFDLFPFPEKEWSPLRNGDDMREHGILVITQVLLIIIHQVFSSSVDDLVQSVYAFIQESLVMFSSMIVTQCSL